MIRELPKDCPQCKGKCYNTLINEDGAPYEETCYMCMGKGLNPHWVMFKLEEENKFLKDDAIRFLKILIKEGI